MRLKLDTPNRLHCCNTELRNVILKSVVSKGSVTLAVRWKVSKRFITFLAYKSRLSNRCNVNGKSRSVLRCLRINRLVIASYQSRGFIKGVYKASW